ncbi:hypothetical protein Lfu02_77980 [Longispora fulva]|uniref:Putative membrane protein n=1 Tax=Longispora fulva TaxID=619741 RepID=A0A8J7GP15_9ACTN|nr:DUF4190 domain-containing protein [Longispora fulva]MBG6136244.1 putative membrane protein [Longispora fulva]GIG63426.1 hypothetical protein Lfu02_77980 [Longispora fulva]
MIGDARGGLDGGGLDGRRLIASRPLSGLAVAALVLSALGVTNGLTGMVGAVLGHVALWQIGKSGQSGRWAAVAAVVIGWTLTVLMFAVLVLMYQTMKDFD